MFRMHGASNAQGTQNKIHWKQAGMIAKHHEGRWTKLVTSWNPATSTKQKGYRKRGSKRWEDDINTSPASSQNQRKQRRHERRDLAHGRRWLGMGVHGQRLRKQQNQTTNTANDPHQLDNSSRRNNTRPTDTHTTDVHNQDGENDDKKEDEDELLILSQLIDS